MILLSCSTTTKITLEQITGKYHWSNIYGVHSTIQLNENKTFEYKWQAGLIQGITYGSWNRSGKKIILNSEIQPSDDKQNNFEILKFASGKSDSLSIKVVNLNNEPIGFVHCILKTDTLKLTGASTGFQGKATIPKLKADSLIIIPPGNYKAIHLKFDYSVSRYEFKMDDINENYTYFTEEAWEYKEDRLYDPSIKKDKHTKKCYYEKIK